MNGIETLRTDVAVVGAGPAGALLAALLAKKGVAVVLLEKHADLAREFRGEHLHDDSVELLKRYSLWAEVEAAGLLPMTAVEMLDGNRPVLTVTPELFGIKHVGIHIPQQHLLEPMVRMAQANPEFRLLLGASVTALLRDESGAVRGVEATTLQGKIHVEAQVVVGADGRFSAVRKLSGIPTKHWKHGYDILWAKVPAPPSWPNAMRFGFYKDAGFALFTAYPHDVQIGWRLPEGGYKEVRKGSVDQFTDLIVEAFPELTDSVKSHIKDWNDFTLLPVQSCMAETWAEDGLLLIGDAAHTMSPAGGAGVNTAMADSETAATVILEALGNGDPSARVLRKVEEMRRPIVERRQATQLEQEERSMKMTRSRLSRWFFHLGMRMLDRSPYKKAFFTKMYVATR